MDEQPNDSFALIVASFMITIVLMNILIAYLSYLYTDLVEKQGMKKLQEMASILYESEVVVHILKKVFKYKSLKSKLKLFMIKKTVFTGEFDKCPIQNRQKKLQKQLVNFKNETHSSSEKTEKSLRQNQIAIAQLQESFNQFKIFQEDFANKISARLNMEFEEQEKQREENEFDNISKREVEKFKID